MAPVTTTKQTDKDADHLERVARLAPLMEESAAAIERDQRLPAALLEELHGARMFRLLLPEEFDGEEVMPSQFFEIVENVARHDASTAWCVCQGNGCAMTAAYLDPAAISEIWGNDPTAVIAWGPGPAEARVVEGGYSLTADLAFASGMHHANWLGCHSIVLDANGEQECDAEGDPIIRTLLFPKSQVEIKPIWDVVGLRGTGSDGYKVNELFVPAERTLLRDEPAARLYHSPLYHFSSHALYSAGFSGTALGIAWSMLEAFKALSKEKRPRRQKQVLRENAAVQAEVALAEVRIKSARNFVRSELEDIWAAVVEADDITVAQRMRIRLCTTFAIHEAKAAADNVYDAAGATAIFEGSPFERRFRDIHTVTQQMQGRKSHFQSVGGFLLGHPPDMTVI